MKPNIIQLISQIMSKYKRLNKTFSNIVKRSFQTNSNGINIQSVLLFLKGISKEKVYETRKIVKYC